MPHVVNGIGTWYMGKRSVRKRRGTCQSCRSVGDLGSYETTLYFVVFFIPLIPLGTKRINEDCPHCRQHRVVSLKKWTEARDLAIGEVANELDQKPGDVETALKALDTAAYFDAKDEFLGLVDSLSPSLLANPEILNALGDAHRHFGLGKEAAEFYRRSLALKDDRTISLRLAAVLFRYGALEEGTRVAEALLNERKLEDVWLLHLYVAALQAAGSHQRAKEALEAFAEGKPALANDKQFKALLKISTKNLATGMPVKSKLLDAKEFKEADGSTGFRFARIIGPVVIAGALALYLGSAYLAGQSRKIHLLNGTSYPYEVVIGGQTFSIGPDSRREISIPEGKYTVSVKEPRHLIPDFDVDLTTNFFGRPFSKSTVVLNPDKLGILEMCTAVYSNNPPPPVYTIYTANTMHDFARIDCAFTPLPHSISVSSNSGSEKRIGLETEAATTPHSLAVISHYAGPNAVVDRIVNGLKFDPDCELYMNASDAVTHADLEPVIAAQTKIRPIIINAHRLYQDMTERDHSDHNLEAEYAAMLQSDPKNSDLQYLAGRAALDPQVKLARYTEAATGARPQPFAVRALARMHFDAGDFESAARFDEQLMKLIPMDTLAQDVNRTILIGTGKILQCLDTPQMHTSPDSTSTAEARDKIVCLALLQRHAEAASFIDTFAPATELEAKEVRQGLLATLAYCEGDLAAWRSNNSKLPDGGENVAVVIQTGKAADAAKLLTAESGASSHIMVAVAAYTQGETELALAQLDLAINRLSLSTVDDRTAAKWLAGTVKPTEMEVRYCTPRSVPQPLFLTALGLRRPELAAMCFPLAKKVNSDPRFPHLLVESALSKH